MIRSLSFSSSDPLSQAWITAAEALAAQVHCGQFRREALLSALSEIRGLTRLEPQEALPKVVERLARCGVALVVVPEFKGLAAASLGRMLTPAKAMIAISLRYRREDGFYFRVFREAGRLIHECTRMNTNEEKIRADSCLFVDHTVFARDVLIPPEAAKELPGLADEQAITAFAERIGVSAGIVVGRMQWDKIIPYSQYNRLRRVMDEGFCALARQGCWGTWPSVTEAAKLAQRDFPHLDLRPARARVSEAAGRGAFVTNGRRGTERRCEPVSLDAWRLRQRDRDLVREMRDEEGAAA